MNSWIVARNEIRLRGGREHGSKLSCMSTVKIQYQFEVSDLVILKTYGFLIQLNIQMNVYL